MATATNSRELFVQGMCVVRRRGSKTVTLAIGLTKNILNFGSKRDRKNCDSRKDAKTPSDGLRSVIPSECEGSEKDFSLRSK